jgi:hypothetical protein
VNMKKPVTKRGDFIGVSNTPMSVTCKQLLLDRVSERLASLRGLCPITFFSFAPLRANESNIAFSKTSLR